MIVVRRTNCFVKKTSFLPSLHYLALSHWANKKNGWDTREGGRNVDFADAYLFFDIYLFCYAWDKGEWPFLLETSHGWEPKSLKTLSYLPLNFFFFCNFLVVPQGCLVKDTPVVLSFNVFHSCNTHECELGSDFGCWWCSCPLKVPSWTNFFTAIWLSALFFSFWRLCSFVVILRLFLVILIVAFFR